jgi:hypothetical protein
MWENAKEKKKIEMHQISKRRERPRRNKSINLKIVYISA